MGKMPLLAIMGIILVAGCTGQPIVTSAEGNGLAVTSFTADVAEQFSGRTVRLFADFENAGESTVDNDKSLIWLGGPIGTGLLEWNLDTGTRTSAFGRDLKPRDVQRDLPAGKESKRWTIKAPALDPGQKKTDTFTVRAYYDYETKAIGSLVAYSEAEAIATREKGESLETSSFSTTKGPIELSARVVPDPVTVLEASGELATIEIVVGNAGGGTVYNRSTINSATTTPALEFDQLNRVFIKIETDLVETGTTCETGLEEELIGGKPTTITCDFNISLPTASESHPIKISATYGYYTEAEVQVTAAGRR